VARNIIYDKGGSASTINGLLKEDYITDQIAEAVNKSTVFLSKLKSVTSTHGRRFVFPVQLGVSQGFGARSENETLPDSGFGEYEQALGNVKYLYGSMYITGQSIDATAGSKAAFKDVLKQALFDVREGAKLDLQRQVFGDGTGKIGLINGAASSATQTVDSPYGLTYAGTLTGSENLRLFRRNMELYFDSGTDAQEKVIAINPSAGTIELENSVNLDDNAVIYRGDSTSLYSKDKEITGISGIVAATGTYLNIVRAGKPEWQGNLVDAAGAITEEKMRIAMDQGLINGNAECDLILTDLVTRRRYEKLLQAQKRFVKPMDLEGGFSALEFDGKPLVADKDAPAERMWFLHTPDINWMVMKEWGFMDRDGAVLSRVANKDAYEANLVSYREMICRRPANQTVLYGITS